MDIFELQRLTCFSGGRILTAHCSAFLGARRLGLNLFIAGLGTDAIRRMSSSQRRGWVVYPATAQAGVCSRVQITLPPPLVGLSSIVPSFTGEGNANSGWFKLPIWIGGCVKHDYAGTAKELPYRHGRGWQNPLGITTGASRAYSPVLKTPRATRISMTWPLQGTVPQQWPGPAESGTGTFKSLTGRRVRQGESIITPVSNSTTSARTRRKKCPLRDDISRLRCLRGVDQRELQVGNLQGQTLQILSFRFYSLANQIHP